MLTRFFTRRDPEDIEKIKDLERELNLQKVKLMGAEARLKKTIRIIDTGEGDPAPTEEKERRAYVARYAAIHEELLDAKLRQLIAIVREQLDSPSMLADFPLFTTRTEYDAYLRGTSNAFKLLLDYGEQMQSEHSANNL